MRHEVLDQISMALAQRVAAGLPDRPEWLDTARQNLARWRQLNAGAPGLLRCYGEWEELLARPVEEICSALTATTSHGQRLRQNSPFAGVLSPAEVWDIKRRTREHASKSA
jgi:hypothetical protein